MPGQPTIRDVAKQCGCSVYTVSSVLNNKGRISERTRRHVRDVARQLNYDPLKNMPLARRVTAKTLAIVVPSAEAEVNPFFWSAISTARRVAADGRHDFKLFTLNDLVQQVSNSQTSPVALGFDGLIVFCCDPPKASIRRIMEKDIPVALVRRDFGIAGTASILDDDAAGTRLMLEHLHQHHGHVRIGMLADIWRTAVPNARLAAYEQYLNEHNIAHDPALVIDSSVLDDNAAPLARLIRRDGMTALFCMGDELAVTAGIALLRQGVRIPDDVALVGYSNTLSARRFFPTVTSVDVPIERMVTAACKTVLNYDADSAGQSTIVRFDNQLVIRESCGCHRRAKPRT